MAKTKKDKSLSVEKCETCQGNPPTSALATTGMNPNFEGTKCSTCFKVITYQKRV